MPPAHAFQPEVEVVSFTPKVGSERASETPLAQFLVLILLNAAITVYLIQIPHGKPEICSELMSRLTAYDVRKPIPMVGKASAPPRLLVSAVPLAETAARLKSRKW